MQESTRVVDALGSSVFEYFAEHQDQAREFSAAMTNLSTPVIREAVTAMDTTDAHFVVDVGRGRCFHCRTVAVQSGAHGRSRRLVEMTMTTPTSTTAILMGMEMLTGFTGQQRELSHFQIRHVDVIPIGGPGTEGSSPTG